MTVGAHFRQSLSVLMDKMLSAAPQFVRCIKPNSGKEPMKFDDLFVLKQLKYTGLLETTRIRREGYPSRLTFEEFLSRYRFIAFPSILTLKNNGNDCAHVLQVAHLQDWCVGKTKVFLRYYHPETLYQVLEEKISKVTTVQKMVRGWLVRRHMGDLKVRLKGEASTLKGFLHGV
jgi:myosin-3